MLSCQLEWAEKAKEEQSEAKKKKRKQKPGETESEPANINKGVFESDFFLGFNLHPVV